MILIMAHNKVAIKKKDNYKYSKSILNEKNK